eukprot:2448581-Pleurochrysis_carterae.AAC.2
MESRLLLASKVIVRLSCLTYAAWLARGILVYSLSLETKIDGRNTFHHGTVYTSTPGQLLRFFAATDQTKRLSLSTGTILSLRATAFPYVSVHLALALNAQLKLMVHVAMYLLYTEHLECDASF